MQIAVIGAGSWGTALAMLAARCGQHVALWAHDPAVAAAISESRENAVYLPGVLIDDAIRTTSDMSTALEGADAVIMATPSHHFRSVLAQLRNASGNSLRLISSTKGIENDSLRRMSEISAEILGDRLASFGVISGPSFALEVAREHPTAALFASADQEWAAQMQHALSCESFRLYRGDDVTGVEVAGAMKNVIAIAAGVVEGVGYGSNTMAALVTRGLSEIRRLGVALGGRVETFAGLAGMGDLILTCTGALSRNRSLGVQLGHGADLETILGGTRSVAEGVRTCRSARDLAEQYRIEMPITQEMHRVLFENVPPLEGIQRLMSRTLKPEG